MRRLRHLLAVAAVTASLVVIPFAGSAFADPLPPGTYDVEVGGGQLTLEVLEGGGAVIVAEEDVEVGLTYDGDGAVQDVFYVRTPAGVDRVEIDVEGEGFVATITEADDDDFPTSDDEVEPTDDPTDPDEGTDGDEDADDGSDGSDDDGSDDDASIAIDEGDEEADDEDEEQSLEGDDEDEVDESHGDVVSTVAACAPRGREAREAGLPNHGSIVSQVARGLTVTIDGIEGEFDVTDVAAAEALCAALDEAVDTAAAAAEDEEEPGTDEVEVEEDEDRRGNGNGRDKGDRGNNGNGRDKDRDRDRD